MRNYWTDATEVFELPENNLARRLVENYLDEHLYLKQSTKRYADAAVFVQFVRNFVSSRVFSLHEKKVEEIRAKKEEILQKRRVTMDEKLKLAEEKRQYQLQMKVRKAHEEENKVYVFQLFIVFAGELRCCPWVWFLILIWRS